MKRRGIHHPQQPFGAAGPLGSEDVKNVILRALVEAYDGRMFTGEDVDMIDWGFRLALFEIKQAYVLGPRKPSLPNA
jgi:hypothetical protein